MTLEPCPWIWLRDRLQRVEHAAFSPLEHAFHFGAAALEAVRLYQTPEGPRILGLDAHLDRMDRSLQALGLASPDPASIIAALTETIRGNRLKEGYIRLLAFADGDCGQLDPGAFPTTFTIQAWSCEDRTPSPPMSLGVTALHRPPEHCMLPGAKLSGSYHLDAAAHHQARAAGFDDALIRHHDGSVCEMTGANLFLVRRGRLETPAIGHTIAGLTRKLVRDLSADLGLECIEARLDVNDFQAADEVFATGTFHGIRAVRQLEDAIFHAPGPVTRALQERYRRLPNEPGSGLGKAWLTPLPSPAPSAKPAIPHEIRPAGPEDVPAVVEALTLLLAELRAASPEELPSGAAETCRRLIEGWAPGTILVAEGRDGLTGVLALNLVEAGHLGSAYGLIQDIWVTPDQRATGLGAALIDAAADWCLERGVDTLEVGLPKYRFARLNATWRFYHRAGFRDVGPRMRMVRQ
ncbi:MAG: GNAT family N-acetyltransferase [Acidobacteriota bacterium]|nr:GNAT family N-acetyltransferase [Acidobacteriota bacterium]